MQGIDEAKLGLLECSNRYVEPLLLTERKFDLRVFMMVMWGGTEWLVFVRKGYVRICCEKFNPSSDELHVHLTNQSQQKKHPNYAQLKEDTVSELLVPTSWWVI